MWLTVSYAAATSLQSCLTLCDLIEGSPPGSLVPEILQARTLEWVAISFSNAWKWKVKVKLLSRVRLLATPWTAAFQAPPSMGFSRQEYWSGVPLPSLTASPRQFLHRATLSMGWTEWFISAFYFRESRLLKKTYIEYLRVVGERKWYYSNTHTLATQKTDLSANPVSKRKGP